jgi:hypothetical protein
MSYSTDLAPRLYNELSKEEQLMIALNRARSSWQSRKYPKDQYQSANERRRDLMISKINSLILAKRDRGELNPSQVLAAEKIIENTNKKESEL